MPIVTKTASDLFESLLRPLYPAGAREDVRQLATLRATDANPAKNPSIFARWTEAADVFAGMADATFGRPLTLDFSDASVHRLGAAIDRAVRDRLLAEHGPDGAPLLVPVVMHGVAYVGECVVRNHGGVWKLRNPLWESLVSLKSRAGEGDLAILSWWLRSLADDEIDRATLADRYRIHVEVPCARPEDLPLLAPPDRRLPRLKRPRYDTFHRHLRAHLPELRDLGADFPSPERFEELAFEHLDFVLVGGGRQLVVFGPSSEGAHLFWLDATGFVKGAFFPCDAFPAPVLREDGEKLVLVFSFLGSELRHEMLWWGP